MNLWLVLTAISLVVMVVSWIDGKIRHEPIDDDSTPSGKGFYVGVLGTLLFGAMTLLSGSITILSI